MKNAEKSYKIRDKKRVNQRKWPPKGRKWRQKELKGSQNTCIAARRMRLWRLLKHLFTNNVSDFTVNLTIRYDQVRHLK